MDTKETLKKLLLGSFFKRSIKTDSVGVRSWGGSSSAKAEESKILKEALDKSSSYNRNLLMIFIAFLAYVLVIVVGTTDRMFVMPDSTIKLPILGADVPVKTFYSITPLIIWMLHLNLFLNLFFHAKKVYEWAQNPESKNEHSHPFIFNFKIKTGGNFFVNVLLAVILYFLYYIAPLVVLGWVNLRFLPYHSYFITGIHHWAIILDSVMSFFFLTILIIADNEFSKYDRFSLKSVLNFLKKSLVYFLIIVAPVVSLTILKIPEKNNEKFPLAPKWQFKKFGIERFGVDTLDNITISKVIHRNLEVPEEKFLLKEVSDTIIVRYLSDNKTREDAERDYSVGIDLKDRDLRFGNFEKTVFLNADFRGAKMERADFSFANLQGAKLEKTNLHGTRLWGAELKGVNLNFGNLQGAYLGYAKLQAASLASANLQGADFFNANLQGASLFDANLQGAELLSARLQGAYFGNAKLYGANFNGASLKCADLTAAHLNGIYYEDIRFLDIITDLDYDNLTKIERSSSLEVVKDNIKLAKERCARFDNNTKDKLISLLKKSDNLTEFINVRRRMACESQQMAKSVLYRMKRVKTNDNVTVADEIKKYMKMKCNEVLQKTGYK
ncbi:pentapeptide repeat-containing protein [Candidatus Magnetomonas plexicatena]|uniref:pentapeptide repeat-containing protein n=1 Tax=Candidatus Magnetomonas plexicatena TaxID=2552947 RepID=UPI001103E362|nr:pentapeptide repeat-containing protein [Nitrospirales bacterium LBB_01]